MVDSDHPDVAPTLPIRLRRPDWTVHFGAVPQTSGCPFAAVVQGSALAAPRDRRGRFAELLAPLDWVVGQLPRLDWGVDRPFVDWDCVAASPRPIAADVGHRDSAA